MRSDGKLMRRIYCSFISHYDLKHDLILYSFNTRGEFIMFLSLVTRANIPQDPVIPPLFSKSVSDEYSICSLKASQSGIATDDPVLMGMPMEVVFSYVQGIRNQQNIRESSLLPFVVRKEKRKSSIRTPESASPKVERKVSFVLITKLYSSVLICSLLRANMPRLLICWRNRKLK